MHDETETHTLDEFLRNPLDCLTRLEKTGEAEVFSVDDDRAVVMLDINAYRKQCALLEQADMIASIAEGIESMEKGEGVPIEEFHAGLEHEFPFLKPS